MKEHHEYSASGIAAMLLAILNEYAYQRKHAYERGDDEAGARFGRAMNILSQAAIEIEAITTERYNEIVARHDPP